MQRDEAGPHRRVSSASAAQNASVCASSGRTSMTAAGPRPSRVQAGAILRAPHGRPRLEAGRVAVLEPLVAEHPLEDPSAAVVDHHHADARAVEMTQRPQRRQVVERGEVADDGPVLDAGLRPSQEARHLSVDAVRPAVLSEREPAVLERRELVPLPDREAVPQVDERAGGNRLRQPPDERGFALRDARQAAAVGGGREAAVPLEQSPGDRRGFAAAAPAFESGRNAGRQQALPRSHLHVHAPRQAPPRLPRDREHGLCEREIEVAPDAERRHVADPDDRVERLGSNAALHRSGRLPAGAATRARIESRNWPRPRPAPAAADRTRGPRGCRSRPAGRRR